MRISEVKAEILRHDLDVTIRDAQVSIPSRIILLVRVRTDDGIEGYGEAGTFGGAEHTVKTIIDTQLAPILIGEDPTMIERHWARMYQGTIQLGRRGAMIAAISGIDIALWDILGKIAGLPVYKLLGGRASVVPSYASAGFYSDGKGLEGLSDEFAAISSKGYRAAKMKVAGENFDADVERVRVAREALGQGRGLMVDSNNQHSPREAIAFAHQIEEFNIAWFEEPTRTDDLDGMAMVRNSISIPVAGYETETTRHGFRLLIESGCVDILQPDTVWAGGITECHRISALASTYHLPVAPHNYAGAISGFSNLHVLAAAPTGHSFEMDQNPNPLRTDLTDSWPEIDTESQVHISDRPGLGFSLNEDVVERYRVD